MKTVTLIKKAKWALKNMRLAEHEKTLLEDFVTCPSPVPLEVARRVKLIATKKERGEN